jgi:hypothetical protein
MICFDVRVNGETVAVAGIAGEGLVHVMVESHRRTGEAGAAPEALSLDIGGLAQNAHLDWGARMLQVGDRVEIEVVEAAHADRPAGERRDDAALVQMSERKYYEHLKAKYGTWSR